MRQFKFFFILAIFVFLFYFLVFQDKVWFDHDDFDFLYFSSQFSLDEIIRPHNEHFLPVFRILFFWEYYLFGLNSQLYFAVSIFLHLVSLYLIYKIVLFLTNKDFWSYIAAILFSINATFHESIIWITSQQTLLCALFFMAAYLTYLYYRKEKRLHNLYFSCIFTVLSAFSFGVGLLAPAYFFVMSLFDHKMNFKARLFYFLSTFISFSAFILFSVSKSVASNPAFSLKIFLKMQVFWVTGITQGLINRFFWAGFYPSREAGSDLLLIPVLTITFFLLIFKIIWDSRKKKRDWLMDISLAFLAVLPYMVIGLSRFPGGFKGAMAERYTYLALAFFIIFLVYEFQLLYKSSQLRLPVIIFVIWILVTHSIYLQKRAFTWLKQPQLAKKYMISLQNDLKKGKVKNDCTIPLYINTRPDPCLRYAKILVKKIY